MLDAAAVPPRPSRRRPHAYDRILYKERNLVERCFAKLKQFRRIATRYDKLLRNFTGFLTLAAITIWLKQLSPHHGLASLSSSQDSRLPPTGPCYQAPGRDAPRPNGS